MQAEAASDTPSAARYECKPSPSSGNAAATHCTRCTGEPSRANEASTDDHAPTRRSCSSAPKSAKLPPRSESAAVSVRPARSCTTPMSCQSARRRRKPRRAPIRRAPRRPVRRAPQHTTTGSHSSPVRPATGTVASAPYRTRMPTAAATPTALGSQRRTITPKTSPTATVMIWPARQPRQRAPSLARPEAVARPTFPAHASGPWPCGHARGSFLREGPRRRPCSNAAPRVRTAGPGCRPAGRPPTSRRPPSCPGRGAPQPPSFLAPTRSAGSGSNPVAEAWHRRPCRTAGVRPPPASAGWARPGSLSR